MRIQHNILAMNSYRNYSNNTSALGKNLEKLSSGYKINRAGDDAAGLAISEKMRAQIKGLDAAQKNVKDGISLVKTAEGAMQEIQDMMSRMKYLATQSANGTYDDDVDRKALQDEVDQLRDEINRIADSSNFNGTKLLDGSLSSTGGSGAASTIKLSYNVNATDMDATAGKYTLGAKASVIKASALTNVGDRAEFSITYREGLDGAARTITFGFTKQKDAKGNDILVSDTGRVYDPATDDTDGALVAEIKASRLADLFKMSGVAVGATYAFTAREEGSAGGVIVSAGAKLITGGDTIADKAMGNVAVTSSPADAYKQIDENSVTAYNGTNADKAIFSVNGKKYVLATASQDVSGLDRSVTVLFGSKFTASHAKVIAKDTGLSVTESSNKLNLKRGTGSGAGGGLTLQIGDTADSFNQLKVSINDMHVGAIGIAGINIGDIDSAAAAIDVIKDGINYVSSTRGTLGAIQNRLEHTQNNLSVMSENIQDAESTIRDTDVADEMMGYVKNNILVQSAQAMLAQANQVPQGVLQLLG